MITSIIALEFVKLLRKSRKGLYDIEIFRRWIRGNTDKTGGEPSLDSLLLLRSIAGQNYQDYLQIPEGFPSRIRLLARGLQHGITMITIRSRLLKNTFLTTIHIPWSRLPFRWDVTSSTSSF